MLATDEKTVQEPPKVDDRSWKLPRAEQVRCILARFLPSRP